MLFELFEKLSSFSNVEIKPCPQPHLTLHTWNILSISRAQTLWFALRRIKNPNSNLSLKKLKKSKRKKTEIFFKGEIEQVSWSFHMTICFRERLFLSILSKWWNLPVLEAVALHWCALKSSRVASYLDVYLLVKCSLGCLHIVLLRWNIKSSNCKF